VVSLLPILVDKVPNPAAQLHWRMSAFCGLFVLREVVRQRIALIADMLRQLFVQRGNEQQLHASMRILYRHRHASDPSGLFPIILVWGLDFRHVISPKGKTAGW
jgi:hypothetical protein